jgi:hypothetical protein
VIQVVQEFMMINFNIVIFAWLYLKVKTNYKYKTTIEHCKKLEEIMEKTEKSARACSSKLYSIHRRARDRVFRFRS